MNNYALVSGSRILWLLRRVVTERTYNVTLGRRLCANRHMRDEMRDAVTGCKRIVLRTESINGISLHSDSFSYYISLAANIGFT
jgi:hypothetical protein